MAGRPVNTSLQSDGQTEVISNNRGPHWGPQGPHQWRDRRERSVQTWTVLSPVFPGCGCPCFGLISLSLSFLLLFFSSYFADIDSFLFSGHVLSQHSSRPVCYQHRMPPSFAWAPVVKRWWEGITIQLQCFCLILRQEANKSSGKGSFRQPAHASLPQKHGIVSRINMRHFTQAEEI